MLSTGLCRVVDHQTRWYGPSWPFQDLVLSQRTEPSDDLAWIFELKYDGWRALAIIQDGKTHFVLRKGSQLNTFGKLDEELSRILQVKNAIVDGEIAVPDETGRTVFADLMHHRDKARFYAFDLLRLNGGYGPMDGCIAGPDANRRRRPHPVAGKETEQNYQTAGPLHG